MLVQLSDAYFELARTQSAELNQYLSQTEPLTVKIEDKVYRVEPSKSDPAPMRLSPRRACGETLAGPTNHA